MSMPEVVNQQKRLKPSFWNLFFSFGFYRATLCVSAVFAVARCLSVTLVHCMQTAEDIVKLFSRPGSPILTILVFDPRVPVPNSKGNPSSGGAKYTGCVRKFCDFRLKSLSISETVQDRPMVANVNRKSYALYRMVTFSMTLTDP